MRERERERERERLLHFKFVMREKKASRKSKRKTLCTLEAK